MTERPDPVPFDATPPSRAAQQQRTRETLVEAAFRVFARDGYHGASLEVIARHAGYSKGAVYSNFAGKSDLFLAVLDRSLAGVAGEGWDPLVQPVSRAELDAVADVRFDDPPTAAQLSRGFGLTTLEFASSAGRDEALTAGLRERLGVLVAAYRRAVVARRTEDDPLSEEDLAFLLAAFDQGFALFALVGWPVEELTMMQRGLGRLLHPAPDETPPAG